MLVKQQDEPKALGGLDGHGSAADGDAGLLQELGRENTTSRNESGHSGFLSVRGFSKEFTSF